MSLRDYFAAAALTGAYAANHGFTPDLASLWAYAAADAMLAERAKT